MTMNRTLLFGVLGCLLAGALIGVSQASIHGKVDDGPMTVPSGRAGDRITYSFFEGPNDVPKEASATASGDVSNGQGLPDLSAWFFRAPTGSAQSSSAPRGDHEFKVAWTKEILELGVAPDPTGQRHDVVVIGAARSEGNGAPPRDSLNLSESVDLATRKMLTQSMQGEFEGISSYKFFDVYFHIGEPSIDGLAYQGRTFRLGDDLSPELAGDRPDPTDAHVLEYSQKRWVADRALVDGHDSYGLRTERTASVRLTPEERQVASAHFGRAFPSVVKVLDRQMLWFTADLPYAILLENNFQLDLGSGEVIHIANDITGLSEFRAGTGAYIPWASSVHAPNYRLANPNLERTAVGQAYPADGRGTHLAYPLSAAVADVQGALFLAQYQAWRTTNPNNHLVSADLGPGEHSNRAAKTSMWRLIFAVPSGGAFEVSTERAAATVPPYLEERGTLTIPRFNVTDLPSELVTVSDAERQWQNVASEKYKSMVPNFVHWGIYAKQTSGRTCLGTSMSMTTTSADMLRLILVGYETQGSCIDRPTGFETSQLTMDAESGNLTGYRESVSEFKRPPLGDYSTTYQPMSRSEKTTFVPRPPDVRSAAAASTSLLAIFLAVYFLPALKFVGAKGLLLIPGYAKLRREDLLDNKIRDQILQVVRNDPGVNTTDLGVRVDAGWGTVVYHVGVLEKNGMISSLVDGRYHRFFPVGVMDFSARGQLAVMKNLRTKAIYELIAHDPGIVQQRLASGIGISAPATIFHLKRLEETGLIGRVKKGRHVHYYANEGKPLARPADSSQGMEIQ
jgi:predicted transcriptional regulator